MRQNISIFDGFVTEPKEIAKQWLIERKIAKQRIYKSTFVLAFVWIIFHEIPVECAFKTKNHDCQLRETTQANTFAHKLPNEYIWWLLCEIVLFCVRWFNIAYGTRYCLNILKWLIAFFVNSGCSNKMFQRMQSMFGSCSLASCS